MCPTLSRVRRILAVVADNTAVPLNRIERVLAFMIAGVGGLSLLAIAAVLIASASQLDLSGGVWPAVAVLPAIGLPIALVLIIVFAIVSIVRRRRLANDSR
jgi:hypothetical protein